MHISEGVLSGPVLITGAVLAAGGVAAGLRRMEPDRVPAVALLSSAFFVGSLIHVPVGPVSMHLVLNGLAGLVLGWMAFPALLVGLALQAVLFQFGGLTTLGINTLNMALPAVVVSYLFRPFRRSASRVVVFAAAACCECCTASSATERATPRKASRTRSRCRPRSKRPLTAPAVQPNSRAASSRVMPSR